jgi:hypothetical protein
MLTAAAAMIDDSRARWLQVKTFDPNLAGTATGFGGVTWDKTYVLSLPGDPEQIRFGNARNHSRIRWAVGKANRLGVAVREASSLDDVRQWYGLYLDTVRSHSTPPRPFRMFEVMWDVLHPVGGMRLLLAERCAGGRSQLLAGSLLLLGGSSVVYAFNGRDRSQLEYRPNDVIQWKAITDACGAGFSRYDFGEVASDNEGLADFKQKWGAAPVDLHRYQYPPRRELEKGLLGATRLRVAGEWMWRRLPLPATERLGGWIYRRL